jgi:hypothetical protein
MMRHAAIWIGLFMLFAVAFVGGLGRPLFTYAACASAIALLLAALASFTSRLRGAAPWLLGAAGLGYLPVIYQRFTFNWGPDWVGLALDMLYLAFLAYFFRSQRSGNAPPELRKEPES